MTAKTFRHTVPIVAAAAALAALSLPATADSAPKVANGWPVMAPGGELVEGPGKSFFLNGPTDVNTWSVTRYTPGGKRLSEQEDSPGCGNCVIHWTDYWTAGPQGVGDPCQGELADDGSCAEVTWRDGGGAVLRQHASGVERWAVDYPNATIVGPPDGTDPPPERAVRDRAGNTYARLWEGDLLNSEPFLSRLVGIDPDGSALFENREEDAGPVGKPVAGLASGVIVVAEGAGNAGETRAVSANGSEIWSYPKTGRVISDPARNRVYIVSGRVTHALDAQSGKRIWRVNGQALSVGNQRGTVFLSLATPESQRYGGKPGRYAVRAVSPTRKVLWQQRTIDEVESALELRDGRVAISTSESTFGGGGTLAVLNPRVREKLRRSGRARLSRRVIYDGPGPKKPQTLFHRGHRTILSLELPKASKVLVQYRDSSGRLVRYSGGTRPITRSLLVPAGRSFTTLMPPTQRLGRGSVVVRWTERGRTRSARLPYVVAR